MADNIKEEIRKQIGTNLKRLIEEKHGSKSMRELDAITGKDHSWLVRLLNGEQNITVDLLSELLIKFKIQPKEVFAFDVMYPDVS